MFTKVKSGGILFIKLDMLLNCLEILLRKNSIQYEKCALNNDV